MKTIDEYVAAARKAYNLPSDSALAHHLNIGTATPNHWKQRRCWPNEATMIKLADLAGVDHEQAILDLNIWRTSGTPVASVYEKLKKSLLNSGISAALATTLYLNSPPPARAAIVKAPESHALENNISYGKFLLL